MKDYERNFLLMKGYSNKNKLFREGGKGELETFTKGKSTIIYSKVLGKFFTNRGKVLAANYRYFKTLTEVFEHLKD